MAAGGISGKAAWRKSAKLGHGNGVKGGGENMAGVCENKHLFS